MIFLSMVLMVRKNYYNFRNKKNFKKLPIGFEAYVLLVGSMTKRKGTQKNLYHHHYFIYF